MDPRGSPHRASLEEGTVAELMSFQRPDLRIAKPLVALLHAVELATCKSPGVTPASCPFFASKQTFVSASGTSALCQKLTFSRRVSPEVSRPFGFYKKATNLCDIKASAF